MAACHRRRAAAAADQALIEAGAPVEALYLVMQGLLGVFGPDVERQLAVLGPGDLVGDMSFLEDKAPTESVRALQDTTVLALPHAALHAHCAEDPAFATRLYRALGQMLSQRLRAANSRVAVHSDSDVVHLGDPPAWPRLSGLLREFKAALHAAHEAAAKHDDAVPGPVAEQILEQFAGFYPREVFDVFEGLGEPAELQATLLDIDLQALAFVAEEAKKRQLQRRMSLVSETSTSRWAGPARRSWTRTWSTASG